MLRTTKTMKDKYEKIQSILFSLIPEKWEKIYLYASVVTTFTKAQSGELFFYYIPKGLLKKKPINVYEVSQRFNINEEQYLIVVKELYDCIKELKTDFINTDQELWTNLTITITNIKFRVEFNYDSLPIDEKEKENNRMIWRYKYLGIGGEKKEEQRILEKYFSTEKVKKNEIYETGLYMKTDGFGVRFDKEDDSKREFIIYEKDNEYMINEKENEKENVKEGNLKNPKGKKRKNKKIDTKYLTDDEDYDEGNNKIKNQILS